MIFKSFALKSAGAGLALAVAATAALPTAASAADCPLRGTLMGGSIGVIAGSFAGKPGLKEETAAVAGVVGALIGYWIGRRTDCAALLHEPPGYGYAPPVYAPVPPYAAQGVAYPPPMAYPAPQGFYQQGHYPNGGGYQIGGYAAPTYGGASASAYASATAGGYPAYRPYGY